MSIPVDSIVALASELVRLPSRAGIDSPEPVLRHAHGWLASQGLAPAFLKNAAGGIVGLHGRIRTRDPGPVLCLDACIDTAPFGDETLWSRPPSSGSVADGRLWGRGAADSKMGVAILSHVARDLVKSGAIGRGGIDLLFDADEHTGRFGGVRAYLDAVDRPPDGALLGYPENAELIRGSRGFHRVRLVVSGRAAHSGATDRTGVNAIAKLAHLVAALETAPLPAEPDGPFAFGPRLTVTQIEGGEGFSVVPDRATCGIDIRLTPGFAAGQAEHWIAEQVARIDALHPSPRPTAIEPVDSWPPYLVPTDAPLVRAFHAAGREAFARDVPLAVCGPSQHRQSPGRARRAHDLWPRHHGRERARHRRVVEVASVPAVYRGYLEGARRFLA
ncbi:MAG: M20/M25/M40 family metallo-hydrolase [Hyphomicrobium sp.]